MHRLQPSKRVGLTLLELLVVLVILTILATIAVQSLQPRIEHARWQETQRLLQSVREASIGSREARQADGTPIISGFVTDIGRLPRLAEPTLTAGMPGSPLSSSLGQRSPMSEEVRGRALSELWSESTDLSTNYPFQFRPGPQQPIDYSDVRLPSGWRGPYLQLPIGQPELLDPWGRPLDLVIAETGEIEAVIWQPTGAFDEPLQSELTGGKVVVSGTIDLANNPAAEVRVVLLKPDPDRSLNELVVQQDEEPSREAFRFSEVPIGLRAICIDLDGRRALTRYVQIPQGGLTLTFDLSQEPVEESPEDE